MVPRRDNQVPDALLLLRSNIHSKNNIFGVSRKAKWARGMEFSAESDTFFYAGCGYQFMEGAEAALSAVRTLDKRGVAWERSLGVTGFFNKLGINLGQIYGSLHFRAGEQDNPLRDAVKVLRYVGKQVGYLGEEEPCCAAPLYFMGFRTEFADKAAETHRILTARGIKRLISVVPSCTYTLKELAPSHVKEWDIEVGHFLEVVHEGMDRGISFRLPNKVRVTYHDPCILSRFCHMVDEPREILTRIDGVQFAEVRHTSKEWSTCCGGGGGFEVVFPDISEILAARRAKELLATGASVIVTACPGCVLQLRDGVKALKAKDVMVMDMAQLLAKALPED